MITFCSCESWVFHLSKAVYLAVPSGLLSSSKTPLTCKKLKKIHYHLAQYAEKILNKIPKKHQGNLHRMKAYKSEI